MAEPVSLTASVLGLAEGARLLIEMATRVGEQIKRFHGNSQHKTRLQELVIELIRILESAQTVSGAALEFTRGKLQSVENDLQSILINRDGQHYIVNNCARCVMASCDHNKLQEVGERLRDLTTQVVVVGGVLQNGTAPMIFNESAELPACKVGLDRADAAVAFLETSASEQIRVIGIYGPPGVGKTTLLNLLWNNTAFNAPFAARAFVELDANPNICSLQADILKQLRGEIKTFPSSSFGREKLRKCFRELVDENKPVFLAIDHLDWEIDHLPNLLPRHDPASPYIFPTSSCVAFSCTNFSLMNVLLRIFNLQRDINKAQVFCFQPPYLDEDESRNLLATCAQIQSPHTFEHHELLNALVPLCGGLPKALTILGEILSNEIERERWRSIETVWAVLNVNDRDTLHVRKPLQLIYDRLGSTWSQAAFLDIVSIFNGWPWKEVERILGVSTMEDLINSSLIQKVPVVENCNQSALKTRAINALRSCWCNLDQQAVVQRNRSNQSQYIVSMHDLILRFGEGILDSNATGYRQHKINCSNPVKRRHFPEAGRLRNLIFSSTSCSFHDDHLLGLIMQILLDATNLQTLALLRVDTHHEMPFLEVSSCQNIASASLHYLMLVGWKTSKPIIDAKVSRDIRDIILDNCEDLEELPSMAPFPNLERLRIRNCQKFKEFPKAGMKEWQSLRELLLEGCHMVTTIPAEVGHIRSLTHVCVSSCSGLLEFPSLESSESLSSLVLTGCTELRALPAMFDHCPHLEVLAAQDCSSLEALPPNIGSTLRCLRELYLSSCKSLQCVPASLVSITSLEMLDLSGCESLVELPKGMGLLTSLKRLYLKSCCKLEQLPASISAMTTLETLDVSGCEKLQKFGRESSANGVCPFRHY